MKILKSILLVGIVCLSFSIQAQSYQACQLLDSPNAFSVIGGEDAFARITNANPLNLNTPNPE